MIMIKRIFLVLGFIIINTSIGTPMGFCPVKDTTSQPVKEQPQKKPLFQKPVKDKISELKFALKDIRTIILVYNGQHPQAKLGFIWDEKTKKQTASTRGEDVTTQLLQRTDRNGLTKTKEDFGPYFHNFPMNPFTSKNNLHIINSPLLIKEVITSPKDYDWIYNIATCEFRTGGEELLPQDTPERREDNSLLDF
ncbi:MAG: hypothetical protein ABIF11_08295 [Nitrospirota bacterium]